MFKKLSLAAGSLFAATSAKAGTLTEPVVEMVKEAEASGSSSSSNGILLPLLLLVAVIAVVSSSDSSDSVTGRY